MVSITPEYFSSLISTMSQPNGYAEWVLWKIPLEVQFKNYSNGKISRWHWEFGDGTSSNKKNPMHIYSKSGNYTVRLTTVDEKGTLKSIKKEEYIIAFIYDEVIDNIDYPKSHYGSYTIIDNSKNKNIKNKFKYKRLFFDSCNVDRYFLETFNQETVFYTSGISNTMGMFSYLYSYISGLNDEEILFELNKFQPNIYSYINFNKRHNGLEKGYYY